MPFLIFRRDHLRYTSGITCGSESFAVQFGDNFRSGDQLRSGINSRQQMVISSYFLSLASFHLPFSFHAIYFYLGCFSAASKV